MLQHLLCVASLSANHLRPGTPPLHSAEAAVVLARIQVYFFIGRSLNASLSQLGTLVLCRALVQVRALHPQQAPCFVDLFWDVFLLFPSHTERVLFPVRCSCRSWPELAGGFFQLRLHQSAACCLTPP